jgi:exosome complex RNA-binding protein Rrp42 (RNase PH superfamily)
MRGGVRSDGRSLNEIRVYEVVRNVLLNVKEKKSVNDVYYCSTSITQNESRVIA